MWNKSVVVHSRTLSLPALELKPRETLGTVASFFIPIWKQNFMEANFSINMMVHFHISSVPFDMITFLFVQLNAQLEFQKC